MNLVVNIPRTVHKQFHNDLETLLDGRRLRPRSDFCRTSLLSHQLIRANLTNLLPMATRSVGLLCRFEGRAHAQDFIKFYVLQRGKCDRTVL